jgi:proteasome alpha subunit
MITPYDWYESLSQRSQYIENRLRTGSPVVGLSITEGVLLYTYRKQVRKVYEVYDRLMFSALGQQADVESLRVTAVEFAHQEGFLRSEQDVTIQRVVGFALSAPLRRAYGDITVAPFVVNALFAEINETPEEDLFFTLRYDGEFDSRRGFAVVAGTSEAERRALEFLEGAYSSALSLEEAQALADRAWRVAADVEGTGEPLPELVSGTQPEVGYLARESRRERRFRHLAG